MNHADILEYHALYGVCGVLIMIMCMGLVLSPGILGLGLFKGRLYSCEDDPSLDRADCEKEYGPTVCEGDYMCTGPWKNPDQVGGLS